MKRAILNENYLNGYIINEHAPIGSIQIFGGETIPNGYLECNGQALSKTSYSRLYSVIGDIYGSTETTFNIPDLRNKFVEGANNNVGTEIDAGLPNITGKAWNTGTNQGIYTNSSGAFNLTRNQVGTVNGSTADYGFKNELNFNASDSNDIYGKSDTVQPPSICMYYIIKATDYTQATEDILDDTKATTGNVWSASKVNEKLSYSTNETVVGTWIDGKPIYRTVFYSETNWSNQSIIGTISNIKLVTNIRSIAVNIYDNSYMTDFNVSDYRNNAKVIRSSGQVKVERAGNFVNSYPSTVVVEYTKTTD